MTALRVAKVADLPEALPAGERVLWQGRPSWRAMAVRALHVRGVAIYFAVLLAWYLVSNIAEGMPAGALCLSMLKLGGLAAGVVAMLAAYAWLATRNTLYTVTNRRVVMGIGVALPVSFNVPFSKVASANLKVNADGTGDISLALVPTERMAYLIMWPHARPWHMARTQPTLRAIPDAAHVAQILGRALAAEADMPMPAAQKSRVEGRRAAAAVDDGHAAAAA